MSQMEDQLDSGGGKADLVFDAEHQKRQSWRFCNSRLPRSEVVYFTQIFILIILTTFSLFKLLRFKLDCEESTFWFSLLLCTVRYALPNPKLWTKLFQLLTGCSWLFADHLVAEKLSLFSKCYYVAHFPQSFKKLYFYHLDQPKFQSFEKKLNIEFK